MVLAIVFGQRDPVFRTAVPVWNPLQWDPTQFTYVLARIGPDGIYFPALVRTVVYVGAASILCLCIAFPVAYYVSRLAGRHKGLLIALLIAPFWISYMMRMLAWVNLLQNDGLVNRILRFGGLFDVNVDWLTGQPVVVILGLAYGYVPYMILPLYAGLDRLSQSMLEASQRPRRHPGVVVPSGDAADVPADDPGRGPAHLPADARRLLHQRPAVRVTQDGDGRKPDQRQRAGAGPDGSGRRVRHVGVGRHGAADGLLRTGHAAGRRGADMSAVTGRTLRGPIGWYRDPWRRPRVLAGITVAYLAWSLLPVLIAVMFSFNDGRSRTNWQGFSFRWYWGDQTRSVWHDASLHTALLQTLKLGLIATLITVPLGVMFAIGIDRWRGRLPSGANVLMLISFVIPEVLLAVALLFVVTSLPLPFGLGTSAQVVGLVTYQVAYPAVLVRARLATIGREYEEAAMDLGASQLQALRRVTLPMLTPAIFASTVLVFADVIDDFVLVRYLSNGSATEPVSVKIYNTARAAPTPALNALATLLLLTALAAVVIGYLVFRRTTRNDATADRSIGAFAGEM